MVYEKGPGVQAGPSEGRMRWAGAVIQFVRKPAHTKTGPDSRAMTLKNSVAAVLPVVLGLIGYSVPMIHDFELTAQAGTFYPPREADQVFSEIMAANPDGWWSDSGMFVIRETGYEEQALRDDLRSQLSTFAASARMIPSQDAQTWANELQHSTISVSGIRPWNGALVGLLGGAFLSALLMASRDRRQAREAHI